MKKFTTLISLCLAASCSSAATAQIGSIHGSIVAGAAYVPEYEGARKQRTVPLAIGRIYHGNRYASFEGPTLRANILDTKRFEFGPVINVTSKRGRHIHSRPVSRLGPIKDAVEAGAFAAISSSVTGKDRVRLSLQGVHDISGVHKGWLSSASASYSRSVSSKLNLSAEVSATYASAEYARNYFTVTSAGSVASGLGAFNAKAGIKDVGATATARYAINDRWSLVGIGQYKRLVGSVAASPIVKEAGSPDQFVAGVGIGFSF